MRKTIILSCILAVSFAVNGFGVGTLNWFTGDGGDEKILYTSDGKPGVGTDSVDGLGADGWYAMLYDAVAFNPGLFDYTTYSSASAAVSAVQSYELFGGTGYVIAQESGGTYASAIQAMGLDPTAIGVSGETVGTILFNVDDPWGTTDYSGMMFAYSTKTSELPSFTSSTAPESYNAGVVGFDGAEWVAVPEPATALFGIIGLVTLAIARRRQQLK